MRLSGQEYEKGRLKSSLRKFYGRSRDHIKQYEVPLSRILHYILEDDYKQWHPPFHQFKTLLLIRTLYNRTFCGVACVVILPFWHFCWCRGFCHRIKTDLFLFLLLPNLTFYLIARGFHITFATGAACQQRTLTQPDIWSCPTLWLASVLMLRPISPGLVLAGLLSL